MTCALLSDYWSTLRDQFCCCLSLFKVSVPGLHGETCLHCSYMLANHTITIKPTHGGCQLSTVQNSCIQRDFCRVGQWETSHADELTHIAWAFGSYKHACTLETSISNTGTYEVLILVTHRGAGCDLINVSLQF